jgi:putative salt-induced outer membrane protein YdiY
LQNGDTLTGEVIRQSDKQVVLNHPALGQVTIGRADIAAVDASEKAGSAQEAGASEPKTSKKPAAEDAPAMSEAASETAQKTAPPPDEPIETTLMPEWEKSIALGFSGSQGNAENSSFNGQLRFKKNTDEVRVDFNNKFFYAQSEDDTTQNEFSSQLNLDWLQTDSPWFFFMQTGYEFDQFEPWRHRASAYGGPGYTFIEKKDVEIVGRLGGGANYEFGSVNEVTPEGLIGTQSIRWNLTERQNLTGGVTYYPSFESSEQYRLITNAEWQIKIDRASGLSLKFGLENEYESITQADARHNDLKYYGALNYDF